MNEILIMIETIAGPPIIGEDGKKDYTKLKRREKDEELFKEFLLHRLKDKELFKEFTTIPYNNKKIREKIVDSFLFNYGPSIIKDKI